MTEQESYLELTHEVDVEARCVLHGKNHISMQPRILNLGHGRAVIAMGQAHCRGPGCNGTSQWITLDLVVTNWENVSEDQFKKAMRHALETEMGVAMGTPPPAEEDEEPEAPEPKKEVAVVAPLGQPAPAQPGGTGLPFRRPALGGVTGVPQPVSPSDGGAGDA